MPFARPTQTQLREETRADFNGSLPGADALLRHSNVGVMAKVQAEAIHGCYGYLDWIAAQSTPYSATSPEHVEAWAALKGVVRKEGASAKGAISFTGAVGALIPAGTQLVRADGKAYSLDADVTLGGGGSGTGAVTALESGTDALAPAGVSLVLSSPIAGVSSSATCPNGLTGATDVEDTPSLKTRMLQAYAAPAKGGSKADYERWALEVPGVTRAWCQPNGVGAGTVIVRFMMDEARAADDGFPQGADGVAADEPRATAAEGDQLAVADYIFPRRPATALVFAAAPLPNTVTFTIAGLAGASLATKTLVEAAIEGVLADQGEPGGTVELSYIEGAIAAIPDAAGYVITAIACSDGTVTPSSNGNIASDPGHLPVRGTVTYS